MTTLPDLNEVFDWDHVRGRADAALTLIEYGDYECPDCGAVFQTLEKLHAELDSCFRLVFRHYPYSGIHKHADLAAEAAEAAGAQGHFWQMHDILFANQSALQLKDLLGYASKLELDIDRFQHELKQHIHSDRVRQNFIRGVKDGVRGTPGLFLNGVRHHGPLDEQELRRLVQETSSNGDSGMPGRFMI